MTTGMRRASVGAVLGAVALLVLSGAWWLVREQGADQRGPGASVLGLPPPTVAAKPALPAAESRAEAPQALATSAPDGAAGGAAAREIAAPRGLEALFTGRVVDEHGAPVADALVTHVPARKLRKELGLLTDVMTGTLAWDRLVQARTAPDGSFRIAARDLPATAGKEVRSGSTVSFTPATQPELVVQHPDFAVLVCLCRTFRIGTCDVGTLTLAAGGTVIGRLVDPEGVPVPDARLRVDVDSEPPASDDSGDWMLAREAQATSSGPDGRFALPGFPDGDHDLQIAHPGFVPRDAAAATSAGETTDLGDVILARGASIHGLLLDASGAPVAGAAMLARPSGLGTIGGARDGADTVLLELRMFFRSRGIHEVRTRTDEQGSFDFSTLDQRHYSVFADAAGWEPACVRDVPAGSSDLVLRLQPQATLRLSVVEATSALPVADARGTAIRRSGNPEAARDGFDPSIEVLSGEAAGELLVQRAGTVSTELTVSAPGHETRRLLLPGVPTGRQIAHTLELQREAVIAGRVLAEGTRAPVADATLTLLPPKQGDGEFVNRTARTARAHAAGADGADGAEGAFRFGELQAGAWTLSVAAPGWLASKPLVLDVKPGEQREDLEVLLQHGATLRVLLLGADSAPAPGREVVVQRADAAPDSSPWKAVTGAEGQALFDALPPVAMELSAFPGARAQVTLSPAQPTEVTLALRRQPRVRGRVTAGGAPVPGASVVASLRTDLPGMGGVFITDDTTSVKASALGGFELQLQRPGEVLLVAHDPADPDASSSVPVTLTMDWDQEQRADLAFGGARVAGLIVDATTQQPLPGAWVVACPHGPILDMDFDRYSSLLQAEARSGDDGRFLLPRVQPGPVQLRVSAKGYSRVVLEDVAALEGDTVEAPRVELSRGTVLTGVVRTASGRTLPPGLRVSVRESADADAAASAGVGEDGSWRIAGHTLAPGAWTLCVEREEVQVFAREMKPAPLASVQVQLVAGDNAPVDLVIDA